MRGAVPTVQPELSGDFGTLMEWADERRRLKVWARQRRHARRRRMAREFGAEGIGLCRTEHMFFEAERIAAVREMILADTREPGRRAALAKLLPMQREDFAELFEIMAGCRSRSACSTRRCTSSCRTRREIAEVAAGLGRRCRKAAPPRRRAARVQPDARPSRLPLGITYPEIYEMQARAIFEAAVEVAARKRRAGDAGGHDPAGRHPASSIIVKARIDAVAEAVSRDGRAIDYLVGTMIELPRACADGRARSRGRRVLLLRHQRPDPDHASASAATMPAASSATTSQKGIFAARSVRQHRRRRRRRAGRASPPSAAGQGAARHQARHLRRARRRSGLDRFCEEARARLRLVLALPRADRAARRGAGGDDEQHR
jgi:hypothetical protein